MVASNQMQMKYLPLFVLMFVLSVSTPITVYIARIAKLSTDVELLMILNSYCFSSAMTLMWVYPFVWPGCGSFSDRLRMATQSIHNWAVPILHANKGQPLNWPFEAYALSDSRWIDYNDGQGLPSMIYYINWNDVTNASLCLIAMIVERVRLGSWTAFSPTVLVLAVWRDATVWRETVEYLFDHHVHNYPYTTTNAQFRPHAIACLWLVNIIWILGPMGNILVSIWDINNNLRKLDNGATKKRQ